MRTFTTIDTAALDTVTGGTSKADSQQRILDKITSMTGAVADVAAQQANKPDSSAAMMPMMAMMMMKKKQQTPV